MRRFPRRTALAAGTLVLAVLATVGVRFTADASTAAAPAAFSHPGVLVSRAQLDFVKGRVAAGAQPWLAAYDQMRASRYASLTRTPKPRATVECGSYSNPNNGCTDEREDAIAAYTDALTWYITGDAAYAKKSIELMDAWSATIRNHTNSNAPLQTAWAGSVWPRAAEIIKHAYGTWPNQARFATMLRDVYLPVVIPGIHSNGNWELSMMEAATGISVFLDDRSSYDRAIARFKLRAASYIYIAADGAQPKYPPAGGIDTRAELISYWQGQARSSTGCPRRPAATSPTPATASPPSRTSPRPPASRVATSTPNCRTGCGTRSGSTRN
ncbi:alginate lyase family protein [Couchioplanes caeruleus]|uniref:alginate lyase family protein n=1 Tax=Couchioplanes caeruleus TaxID=56438 RepID=UPI0020BD68B5|nr:alginate lyase family protein [Couchioplanes caeruleus]UQU61411.1 alginate lyase family protein [Couchioplanes caeruleus]